MRRTSNEAEQLRNQRVGVQTEIRQVCSEHARLQAEIDDERHLIQKFEEEIEAQRVKNFKANDENLDLLAQTEALENHVRMVSDQNKIISAEIDKFICEDDDIA